MTSDTNLAPYRRAIPPDYSAVTEQALLNLFIGMSASDIASARDAALQQAVETNISYDAWLRRKRNRESTSVYDRQPVPQADAPVGRNRSFKGGPRARRS